MTIATWNINGINARLRFVLHWLAARQPDVVLMQELKIPDDRFPHIELEAAGYQALVYGQSSWNGVAILTRRETVHSTEVTCRGLPGLEEQGARLISARVEAAGVGFIDCVSVYVPNGRTVEHREFKKKLVFLDKFVNYVKRELKPTMPNVIGGDFNLCPGPLDTWNEEACPGEILYTPEEHARYEALISLGLVDLFRAKYPKLRLFSCWDYRAGNFHKNIGLRIDLILATPPVAEHTKRVTIDRHYRKKKDGMVASDHAPVIAEIFP